MRMAELQNAEQCVASPICVAAEAPGRVPASPGYYAIFIDVPSSLTAPFCNLLLERNTKLIYIGIATRSLYRRLVEQDLHHRGPSSFFRGVGAILGYRPLLGSLAGEKNRNNYRFSPTHTAEIVGWINEHLSVNWFSEQPALNEVEKSLIQEYFPILNTNHNPEPVRALAKLRLECRTIATTAPAETGDSHILD